MSNDLNTSERPRPFRIIDGRKWVLAEDEPWDETDAEPEELASIPPSPREIPLAVRLHLWYGSGLGGTVSLLFAMFGLAFVLLAVYVIGMDDAIPRRWVDAGAGKITKIEDAKFSINETSYDNVFFTATGADGKPVDGSVRVPRGNYNEGDNVALERAGKRFRIKGMRISFGVWLFFGMGPIFAGAGLVGAGHSYWQGRRKIRLLRDGETGTAFYLGMESTSMHVNNRTLMKVAFQYTVDGEQYTCYNKTLDTDRLTDGGGKIVFYDPFKPDDALVFETLHSGIRIDELNGRFRAPLWSGLIPLFFSFVVSAEIIGILYGLGNAIF